MARGVKKAKAATLTPEEKLAQALVPVEEQPYPVPGNWCWVFFGTATKNYDSKRVPLSAKQRSNIDKIYDYYGASGVIDKVDDYIFDNELLLIGEDGANLLSRSTDIAFLAQGKYWVNNHAHVIDTLYCSRNYMRYYINSIDLSTFVTGTAQPKLTQDNLNSIPIPLPPFAEQQRIVDRIESLFAKLDEAKEKTQTVVDGFEDRKAAILHKAFAGELTKKWRAKNGHSFNEWCRRKLKDCGNWMGGGTPSMSHPEYWENGDIPWITSKDMKTDLIEDTLMHTNMLGINNSSASYIEKPSVLFVMRSGILRRTLPIAVVKKPYSVNQDLKAVSPSDIDVDYLFWACECEERKMLNTCMKSGTTVESINADALFAYEVSIAPREEQPIIVDTIERLLHKENQSQMVAEKTLTQIDTMKKAILARAFRGELGTNDPTDESAEELLKMTI